MNNKKSRLLIIIFTLIFSVGSAQSMRALRNQSDSFSRVTRNKVWTISKYLQMSKQTDKKSVFDNIGFKFSLNDSTNFKIILGGNESFFGRWAVQNDNNVLFSMPLIVDAFGEADTTNAYNQAVKLLCSWPLKKVSVQSSLLKFRLMDPFKGETFVEFVAKDCVDCKGNKKQ